MWGAHGDEPAADDRGLEAPARTRAFNYRWLRAGWPRQALEPAGGRTMVRGTAKLVEAYLAAVSSRRRRDLAAAALACSSVTRTGSAGGHAWPGVRTAAPEARPA